MSSTTSASRSNSGTDGYRAGPTAAGLFVALFAFLLASFPARNADVWGYLAAGRDLVRGHTPDSPAGGRAAVGTDSSWLFDLMCYGVYSATGSSGLVVVKALLVGGVALVLFRLSRTGSGVLIPTFAVGLVVLTMST